jgi:serine/threonine protein kinase
MNELGIISAISHHENIVNLIGACTKEEGWYYLSKERCAIRIPF